jgi:hypothetical protein
MTDGVEPTSTMLELNSVSALRDESSGSEGAVQLHARANASISITVAVAPPTIPSIATCQTRRFGTSRPLMKSVSMVR